MPKKPPKAVPQRDRQKRRRATKAATAPLPIEPLTPPPGPGHLPPLGQERAENHRAFLLWAMQAPDRRSMRAVSRALGVGDRTIRRWHSDYEWESRSRMPAADRLAWQEYLGRYAELFGIEGIAIIQDNMDVLGPITPLAVIRARLGSAADARAYPADSAARRVLEDAAETSRQVMGDVLHDPDPDDEPGSPEEIELDDEELEDEEDDPALPPSPLGGKRGEGGKHGPVAQHGPPTVKGGGTREQPAASPGKGPAAAPGKGPGMGKDAAPDVGDARAGVGDARGDAARRSAEERREQLADPAARRTRVDEHRTLVRATLGVYSQELQAHAQAMADARKLGTKPPVLPPHLRVRPADLGILIELEQALIEAPKPEGSGGPLESVRVRTAREEGADLLDALEQDNRELSAVLEALRQKRAQDAAHLRAEMERRAQVIELRRGEAG